MKKLLVNSMILFLIFNNIIFNVFNFPQFVGYWDEFIEFLIILFGLFYNLFDKKHKNKNKNQTKSKSFLISLFAIIVLGLLGNIINKYMTDSFTIIRDLVVFLKFPLVLYILTSNELNKKISDNISPIVLKIVKFSILIMFIFGVINIFTDIGMSISNDIRLGIRPFKFLYSHPTYLVLSSIIMLSLMNTEHNNKNNLPYELLTLIIIILSGRTKGIVMVAAYIFMKYTPDKIKKNKALYIGLIGAIIAIFSYNKLSLYASYSSSPREQLYNGALMLSKEHFPIGSGFASYASHLSGKYGSTAYEATNTWFYQHDTGWGGDDLGDAGYAYYLAQFGIIGSILLLYTLYYLYNNVINKTKNTIAVQTLFLYIIIALTTETTLLNYGLELAFMITITSKITIKEDNVKKLTK